MNTEHADAVRFRAMAEALQTAHMGGPQPWASEAGIRGPVLDSTAWCALWYSAILRRVGIPTPSWKIGGSVLTAALPRIAKGKRARMGDLGYVERGGHHAFVVHDDGDEVTSIDGNGPGRVVVVDRVRPRSDYAAFYSINELVKAWVPRKYRGREA